MITTELQKLAVDGGQKTVTSKLTSWPRFEDKAINAVEGVLRSGKVNYWTGPKGMEFEKNLPNGREVNTPFLLPPEQQRYMLL